MKKVSVIIPYVKDRGWLKDAIRSVRAQTYKNTELILVRGKKYRGGNLNDGIIKSTGEFIKPLDEDDMLLPDCIEKYVQAIGDNDFIHGNAIYYLNKPKDIYAPKITNPTFAQLAKKNVISNPSVMYRRDLFTRIGYFDESLYRSEDFDFHLRALKKGCKLGYINEALVYYRLHHNQETGKNNVDAERRNKLRQIIILKYL